MKILHICSFLLIHLSVLAFRPLDQYMQIMQDTLPDIQNDSILIAANPDYRGSNIVNFLFGKNYRKEWAHPVKLRIFKFSDQDFRDPSPIPGTAGIDMVASNHQGEVYQFSLIEKTPAPLLSGKESDSIANTVMIDGISASYPYGAPLIARLEEAIGLPYTKSELIYLPDDPALGALRHRFGNRIVFMKKIGFSQEDLLTTDSILSLQQEDPAISVNEREILRQRLFDLVIMDFNRGDAQWQWIRSSQNPTLFHPVPRERGQYFFINNGLLPRWLSSAGMFPELQGFRRKTSDINTFNSSNVVFDKTFLNTLTAEDWTAMADSLKLLLSDTLIIQAMHEQPAPVFEYSGPEIIEILKDRRDRLTEEALTYYRFLSDVVEVAASNRSNSVIVDRKEDGLMHVSIRAGSDTFYSRLFKASETSEVRIYGLKGDDHFVVTGSDGSIVVRLIGGSGSDNFTNRGSAPGNKTHIYDQIPETNIISGNPVKRHLSHKESVNRYERNNFYYDRKGFGPRINFTFDDGIVPGISYRIIRQRFRKHPYQILHEITADYAIGSRAIMFGYRMVANGLIGSNDLVFNSGTGIPGMVVNFLGYGNDTRLDKKGKGYLYYRTRFNSAYSDLLLRKRFGKSSSVSIGPSFRYANVRKNYNEDRIINLQSLEDIDLNHLYGDKYYVGPRASLSIDTRNNKIIPLTGIHMLADLAHYTGLNDLSNSYGRYTVDLSGYINPQKIPRMVIALRIGMGVTTGDAEYFQHQFLSGHNNLRGFRRYRFAGDQMLYTNVELRYHLADFRSYLFPGAFGLQVFHDMGRVWHKSESSNTWHHGPGLGLWLAPARRIVATGSLIFSKEGPIPYATIGFRF